MSRRQRKKQRLRGVPLLEEGEVLVVMERPARIFRIPKYLFSLGLYGIWRKRDVAAVTNRRLLFGHGVVRRSERSIPLRDVHDVAFVRRGFTSYASVLVGGRFGGERVRIGPTSAKRARGVAASLQRYLHGHPRPEDEE